MNEIACGKSRIDIDTVPAAVERTLLQREEHDKRLAIASPVKD
jgi:hypothetical protein